ncbi:hypothetical protein HII36_13715 [Nonomuraea sp. NN258]|uniref:hypothetical protein n=1 Tax=Nonomuraea antri TaxID=2730852 RepID=UPI001568958A|nr:hypothetical protein [Nonomuraea antri]NRQ32890.1 hypothetical protein [Nonomuraea antri]
MRTWTRFLLTVLPVGAGLLLPATAWAWPRPDPGDPFTMSTGSVSCRTGTVDVTLRNETRQLARYDLRADGTSVATGSIPARKKITKRVPVDRGSRAEIEAYSVSDSEADTLIDSTDVENDCPWGRRHGHLPYTGPTEDLMGKLATAGGMVVMGGIMWWYSSIWPRSQDPFR